MNNPILTFRASPEVRAALAWMAEQERGRVESGKQIRRANRSEIIIALILEGATRRGWKPRGKDVK